MGQGAKFRGCKSVEHSLELFQESLDNFAMRLSDATPLEMALSDAFKQAVLAWKSAVLDRYRALCEADTRNFAVRADVSRAIRLLRDNFVIAPMDKNPQSLVILCSDNYCSRLQEHLSSPVYSAATISEEEIFESALRLNSSLGLKTINVLPYVYIVPKLHKEPTRPFDRFIAGATSKNTFAAPEHNGNVNMRGRVETCFSAVGKKLSDFFESVIDVLLYQDGVAMRHHQPRRIWIIRDQRDCIRRLQFAKQHILTDDFTTMYTQFKHEDLLRLLEYMVRRATSFVAEKLHLEGTDSVAFAPGYVVKGAVYQNSWFPAPSGGAFTATVAMSTYSHLVNNTYFRNGDRIFRQIVGVGMGAPPSGPATTLALAALESNWVDAMVAAQPDEVRKTFNNFESCTRYIDDRAATDIPRECLPTSADYGMQVVAAGSSSDDNGVDYLMYNFRTKEGITLYKLRDKQRTFPFMLIKYPSSITTITESCKVGCVVGGLVTAWRTFQYGWQFQQAVCVHFKNLYDRRFSESVIRQGIKKFLNRNVRRDYHTYFWRNFFTEWLLLWPYQNDVTPEEVQQQVRSIQVLRSSSAFADAVLLVRDQPPADKFDLSLVSAIAQLPMQAEHVQPTGEKDTPDPSGNTPSSPIQVDATCDTAVSNADLLPSTPEQLPAESAVECISVSSASSYRVSEVNQQRQNAQVIRAESTYLPSEVLDIVLRYCVSLQPASSPNPKRFISGEEWERLGRKVQLLALVTPCVYISWAIFQSPFHSSSHRHGVF